MKIIRHGVVIISNDKIRIEDWRVEQEPNDPTDSTTEQQLVYLAVKWALKRLQAEVLKAFGAKKPTGTADEVLDSIEPKSVQPN